MKVVEGPSLAPADALYTGKPLSFAKEKAELSGYTLEVGKPFGEPTVYPDPNAVAS